jgi:hypothetical protein
MFYRIEPKNLSARKGRHYKCSSLLRQNKSITLSIKCVCLCKRDSSLASPVGAHSRCLVHRVIVCEDLSSFQFPVQFVCSFKLSFSDVTWAIFIVLLFSHRPAARAPARVGGKWRS